jgi:hypothetical protein
VKLVFSWRPSRRTVILLAVLILLGLGHAFILRLLARPLVADDSSAGRAPSAGRLAGGDYFCLHGSELGTDGYEAFAAAAAWHGESAGRKILLLLPHPSRVVEIGAVRSFEEACRSELGKCGIPAADIRPLPADALDVWGEARALSEWLKERPDATVRLACSSLGSGRLRFVLNKVLDPADARRVHLATLPDPRYSAERWWRSRTGVKDFMYAWLDLAYTWTDRGSPRPCPPNAARFQEEVRAKIGEAPP